MAEVEQDQDLDQGSNGKQVPLSRQMKQAMLQESLMEIRNSGIVVSNNQTMLVQMDG